MANTTTPQDFTQLSLGQRILALRDARKLSLRTLADKVDLSASFLSQIERDETSPSIASLEKIAQALEVDVARFFDRTQPDPFLPVRDRPAAHSPVPGVVVERLSRVPGAVQPSELRLEAGEHTVLLPNRGEVFFYLLKGEVKAVLEDREVALREGDTLHLLRQGQLLALHNTSTNEAELLTINYL